MNKDYLLEIGLVIDNEWLDLYVKLINDNLDTLPCRYKTLIHHIIPRFYFNDNNLLINNFKDNLVNLSIKDHLLAHYYLCRCSSLRYFGKNYASIALIIQNHLCKDLMPELLEFVNCLDNIDIYYELYRQLINITSKTDEAKDKVSLSLLKYYDNLDKSSDEWLARNKNISNKLKGRKFSESHRQKLSECAKQRTGEKNSFYGKTFSSEAIKNISYNNSDFLDALDENNNKILNHVTIKYAIEYLKLSNKLLNNGSAFSRNVQKAANDHTLYLGYYWIIYKKLRKQKLISDQGMTSIKEAVSKSHGTAVTLHMEKEDIKFNSLSKAANFVLDNGWDNLHPKNIGIKIKKAAETDLILYNYKWSIFKV